jgi:putative phage-type endonuclease
MNQNAEWLEFRLQGIGSSDAPAVMRVSPWLTPYQLWEIKTRRAEPAPANGAMQRGIMLEDKARYTFEQMYGKEFKPLTVQNEKHGFIRASLDGINGRVGLEIKCPGKDDHAQALAGKIPEKYIYQLAHQCLAADLEKVEYFSFDGDNGTIVTYNRDPKIETSLFKEESKFWDLVKTDTPPGLLDREYRQVTDDKIIEACSAYKANKAALEELERQQKELKKILTDAANGKAMLCNGIAVQTIVSKGRVDYESIEVLKGVDLEQYRKKPTTSVRITLRGDQ